MENITGQYAQMIALAFSAFFVLSALSGMVNLYLRYHDDLPIEREDIKKLTRNSALALLCAAIAALFRFLPFFMAIGWILSGVVVIQIFKINGLLKVLSRHK